jgi:hypothetical protein
MSNFWSGALVGLVTGGLSSALVAYVWELRTRKRLHDQAEILEGRWIAHDMLDGRTIDRSKPMDKSWPTVMTPKPHWWSVDSHILDIKADDISNTGGLRPHKGYLVIDRVCPWVAIRVIFYAESDEVAEQRILMDLDRDRDTLHVFPVAPAYNRHALRRG